MFQYQNAKTASEDGMVSPSQTPKRSIMQHADDIGIAIIDDDIQVDQEKINEERRAYLEKARSQEAYSTRHAPLIARHICVNTSNGIMPNEGHAIKSGKELETSH